MKNKSIQPHNQSDPRLTETVKLSELKAKGGAIRELSYEHEHLVPLLIEIGEEEAAFEYNLSDLSKLVLIKKKPLAERYRLLMNASSLELLAKRYEFSLAPDNLYYDRNLSLRVLRRDIVHKSNFLIEYKSLCGYILSPKYSYEDFLNGGTDLFKSNKLLARVNECSGVTEISELFRQLYDEECAYISKTRRTIGKGWFIALVVALSVTFVVGSAGVAFSIYTLTVKDPFDRSVITAANAFIAEDYDAVVAALSGYTTEQLDKNARFVLANSYVVSESLTNEQKRNIRAGLTLKTDDNIINYWILLGRESYDEALDLALRLNDDELQLFALIKQQVAVEQDTALAGADKAGKIDAISKQIESLRKKLEEAGEKLEELTATP